MSLTDAIRTADFKAEKHVPVIDIVNREGEYVTVGVKVGKEVPHPNTTEHHIVYIDLFYQGEGDKFIQHVGRAEFSAHGASLEGPNQGDLYTEPAACFKARFLKPGKLTAIGYCNIHGLWQSEMDIVPNQGQLGL